MKRAIIAISNRKGGVGKSTTAHALGSGLSLKGNKVLMIDLDSQCNLSQSVGTDPRLPGAGQVLRGEAKASEAVQTVTFGLDIIQGGADLARADLDISETGKEYRLKEKLEKIISFYDFVIIDTPPALGILTINALTAADRLVIPAQADYFSLKALDDLQDTVETIRKYTNAGLMTEGILLTRHNARTIFTRELDELITETALKFNTKVFKARIREAVAIKEAQAMHESIFTYSPKAKVTKDYQAFIDELISSP
ncbi:MAG: ParA family protein [Lachnospiraceae bacterium]|nr:ParA family protein [Lachnospiraceae bacterium]